MPIKCIYGVNLILQNSEVSLTIHLFSLDKKIRFPLNPKWLPKSAAIRLHLADEVVLNSLGFPDLDLAKAVSDRLSL